MLLKDFLKLWVVLNNNEVIIIDRSEAKCYYDLNIPSELMFKEVIGFYFDYNRLTIRIK